MIVDSESSTFERSRRTRGIHADLNRVGTAMLPRIPVQILGGTARKRTPSSINVARARSPHRKESIPATPPLASLRSAISDFPSRGPSTCSVPSRAGTVLQSCDGIGRRASQFPWHGRLSRLLTSWLSFLNPTVLDVPRARLKLDVGVTPLPGGACALRTPATASPSAPLTGRSTTCIASGHILTAIPCIPWRTRTSPCTGANGRAPCRRSALCIRHRQS